MAKKNMLERERKRKLLVSKYATKRKTLLSLFKSSTLFHEKLELSGKIQKLLRDSAKIRIRNRCWKTGRPRGYFRMFGLCRNSLREMAQFGYIPGLIKSSW
jgi:small subunit ribosomal protein S14